MTYMAAVNSVSYMLWCRMIEAVQLILLPESKLLWCDVDVPSFIFVFMELIKSLILNNRFKVYYDLTLNIKSVLIPAIDELFTTVRQGINWNNIMTMYRVNVFIYIYIHAHTYTHTHIHTYIHIHTCTHTYIHTQTPTHTNIYIISLI